MGSLMGSMSIALGSLRDNQEALDVTTNNIANINTPGYSRQVVNVSETNPIQMGQLQFGTGAQIDNIQSIRDQVLEFRLNSETSTQSSLNGFLQPMQQVQATFNEAAGTGLQSSISAFYNSLTQLSTDPSNVPLRQGVIAAAQGLASTFNNAATSLTTIGTSMDAQVPTITQQVNTIAQSIANLNLRIGESQNTGQQPGVLEDQRNQLIQNLSQVINIQASDGGHGMVSISIAGGIALVVGGQGFALTNVNGPNPPNVNNILSSDGTNVTKSITGGQLGGILRVRDQAIPALLTKLDTLSAGIAKNINAGQAAGFDLNNAAGQNLFNVPATTPGTAQTMSVNITNPSLIAAAGPGGLVGDNSNVVAMAAQQSQTIVSGQTPLNYYSNTVGQLGTDIQLASNQLDSQNIVVQQLQTQRTSLSGVSLDEEAANLVKYQRAYQAAARVVSVIDQMTQTAIGLGVGGA
jgi:flagellar hook-associated protein 1 FlgK